MIKVLVIEDNLSILRNTAEFLKLEGYAVTIATNGKNGLKKIYELIPDIIICDLLMPEMGGFELLGIIGKHPKYNRIPVILFSAKTEKSDVKKGLGAGAVGYITKPFDLDELLQTIKHCLKKRKHPKII